jgi:MT0933-like antitoxin protein
MGLLDRVKGMFSPAKAKEMAAEHGDQVVKGVDTATDVVDQKTEGKFSEPLDKVDTGAEQVVDKLDGDN